MEKRIILGLLVLSLSLCMVQAQNLKPVKDKASKKFGYQDDAKNWVIAPQYDKAKKFEKGVAVVTIDKMEGAIDTEGKQILPFDSMNIKIDNKYNVIHAERVFQVENQDYYLDPVIYAWGLYTLDGAELFPPRFEWKLPFDKDGRAIATDKGTGKQGVVDIGGNTELPLDFYYVSSVYNGYNALNEAMRIVTYSKDFRTVTDDNLPNSAPWVPMPYSTNGDDVRAFTYGLNHIGEKLYRNRIWTIGMTEQQGTKASFLTYLLTYPDETAFDWGNDPGAFIRLEPVVDKEKHEGSFLYGITDTRYTIQACLYDASGRFIKNVSNWGCLYAMSNEGLIYLAEGKCMYFIGHDVNWKSGIGAVKLTGYSMIDNSTLNSALGINSSMQNEMRTYWKARRRHAEVEVKEKTGYQSYRPFVLSGTTVTEDRFLGNLYKNYPFLNRNFRAGQVFGIDEIKYADGGNVTISLLPDLPAKYHDDYGNGFSPKTVEPVFWGVKGDRFIRIAAVPFKLSQSDKAAPEKVKGMVDDTPGSDIGLRFVFNLYEDDGTFVRTIGSSNRLTIAGHDVFGFDDIEWVFTRTAPVMGIVKYRENGPLTNFVSFLKNVDF